MRRIVAIVGIVAGLLLAAAGSATAGPGAAVATKAERVDRLTWTNTEDRTLISLHRVTIRERRSWNTAQQFQRDGVGYNYGKVKWRYRGSRLIIQYTSNGGYCLRVRIVYERQSAKKVRYLRDRTLGTDRRCRPE